MKYAKYILMIAFMCMTLPVSAGEPGNHYKSLQDEQRQFKELVSMYMDARHAVERPVQFRSVGLARSVEFNFEPTIMTFDQGMTNTVNMKIILQLTANIL